MNLQKFYSTTVLHMVLESSITHFGLLPKYPYPSPDANRQKSLQVPYRPLCMSFPSVTVLQYILLCFLGAEIFQVSTLSLHSAARLHQ